MYKRILSWTLLFALLAVGLGFWAYGQVARTIEMTRLYGKELSDVISIFEQAQYSDEVRRDPDMLSVVATTEYVDDYRRNGAPLDSDVYGPFWTPTTTHVTEICVISYSPADSVVRAAVERRRSAQVQHDFATYALVKIEGSWKVSSIAERVPMAEGQADLTQVAKEWGVRCLMH